MNRMKKLALVLALVVAVLLGMVGNGSRALVRDAVAGSSNNPNDTVACNTVTLNAASALVVTASSGNRIIIKALKCASSTADTVTFQDGTGGVAIGQVYLAANTPTELAPEFWAPLGCRTTSGNGIFAIGTGTLSVQLVIGYQ